MLALTRKIGERIVLNDNISVTIVDVKGDSVKLAVDAPKSVKIYRGEIYDSIAAENKQAADGGNIASLGALKGLDIKK